MIRRARAKTLCAGCGKTIMVGEPMRPVSFTGYTTAVMHPHCREQWVAKHRVRPNS